MTQKTFIDEEIRKINNMIVECKDKIIGGTKGEVIKNRKKHQKLVIDRIHLEQKLINGETI